MAVVLAGGWYKTEAQVQDRAHWIGIGGALQTGHLVHRTWLYLSFGGAFQYLLLRNQGVSFLDVAKGDFEWV